MEYVYTVQYMESSSGAICNFVTKAVSCDLAEAAARVDRGENIRIIRSFKSNATPYPQHTTTAFRRVKTPAESFNIK